MWWVALALKRSNSTLVLLGEATCVASEMAADSSSFVGSGGGGPQPQLPAHVNHSFSVNGCVETVSVQIADRGSVSSYNCWAAFLHAPRGQRDELEGLLHQCVHHCCPHASVYQSELCEAHVELQSYHVYPKE